MPLCTSSCIDEYDAPGAWVGGDGPGGVGTSRVRVSRRRHHSTIADSSKAEKVSMTTKTRFDPDDPSTTTAKTKKNDGAL
jgi:hypothetical protein